MSRGKHVKKKLLFDIVKRVQPCSALDWQKVVELYKIDSREEEEREYGKVRNYWRNTLCLNGRIPTGATQENKSFLLKCQKLQESLSEKASDKAIGGDSSIDDDNDNDYNTSNNSEDGDIVERNDSINEDADNDFLADINDNIANNTTTTQKKKSPKTNKSPANNNNNNSGGKTKNNRTPRGNAANAMQTIAEKFGDSQNNKLMFMMLDNEKEKHYLMKKKSRKLKKKLKKSKKQVKRLKVELMKATGSSLPSSSESDSSSSDEDDSD